jgi:hypothetical protein
MAVVKKYSLFVSVALFALTIVSVFLSWVTLEVIETETLSLWDSEAGARLVLIVLSAVAALASIAAATSMKDKMKAVSGLNIAFAIVNIALGTLFVMDQKSQAEDLGIPSDAMGYGIGFIIMLVAMVLAVLINVMGAMSKSESV